MNTPTKDLTAKQKLFVAEYLIDLNATQAAIRSGYSEKTAQAIGAENLTKPLIASAIQEAMDKRSAKTEINAEYVLNGIKGVIERCTKEVNESDKFDPSPALKGYELLGKHLKLFTEKVESNVQHSGSVFIEVVGIEPKAKNAES